MQYQKVDLSNFNELIVSQSPQLDLELISQAVEFAAKAHQNQKRCSGEEYINHPLSVGLIIASLGLGPASVVAGILHDVVEDSQITSSQISQKFSPEIARLVEAVTKIKYFTYKSGESAHKAENYRKLLLAITKDVRVVFIKIADRLHNMRTLQHMPPDKQHRIAQETLEIYVPLANRFGIQDIKRELEDLCLKYLYPDTYQELHSVVKQKKSARDAYINDFVTKLTHIFSEAGISTQITGRSKHFWSIFRKKVQRNIAYRDINDYYGIRIITPSVEDCFNALGIINASFQPLPDTYKDYISLPKTNGYQSLHQVIISAEGHRIEIQIRTPRMHKNAEQGSAAHWKYKEISSLQNIKKTAHLKLDNAFDEQVQWLQSLLDMYRSEQPEDFVAQLKSNLLKDKIIVKTPQNDYVQLPLGATPLDFAFAVHTQIGLHCLSARVNNQHVSLRYQLQHGDTVEIKTARNVKPSKDWIDFLASPRARQRVKSWFRKQEIDDALKLGKNIFDKEIKKNDLKISQQDINELVHKLKYPGPQNFYCDLGQGNLLIDKVMALLLPDKTPDHTELPASNKEFNLENTKSSVEIQGLENLMIHFAKCCNPLPGDDIIGYITRGRGLSVHKKNCPNPAFIQLCQKEPHRLMNLHWSKKKDHPSLFITRLKIYSLPRPKLNYDISTLLSQHKINTLSSSSEICRDHEEIELLIEIENKNQLKKLKNALKSIKGIINITS